MTIEDINTLKTLTPISHAFVLKNDNLSVLSSDKSICAFCDSGLTEFSTPAPIYNVPEFINIISTLGVESDVEVSDKSISVINSGKEITYMLSNTTIVPNVPNTIEDKFLDFDIDIKFTLLEQDLEQIKKLSQLMGLDEATVSWDAVKKTTTIYVGETGNKSSNALSILVNTAGENNSESVDIKLNISNIQQIINSDYEVQMTTIGLTKFSALSSTNNMRYYIAIKS